MQQRVKFHQAHQRWNLQKKKQEKSFSLDKDKLETLFTIEVPTLSRNRS